MLVVFFHLSPPIWIAFFRVSCCGYFEVNIGERLPNQFNSIIIMRLLVDFTVYYFVWISCFQALFFLGGFFLTVRAASCWCYASISLPFSTHNFAASAKSSLRWNFDLRVIFIHVLSVLHFLDTVFFHVGIIIGIVHTVNHSFGHSWRRSFFLFSSLSLPLCLSSSFSSLTQWGLSFYVPTTFLPRSILLLLVAYNCINQKMFKTQPNEAQPTCME